MANTIKKNFLLVLVAAILITGAMFLTACSQGSSGSAIKSDSQISFNGSNIYVNQALSEAGQAEIKALPECAEGCLSFLVDGSSLYYMVYGTEEELANSLSTTCSLYSCNLDGSNNQKLTEFFEGYSATFVKWNNIIYFSSGIDASGGQLNPAASSLSVFNLDTKQTEEYAKYCWLAGLNQDYVFVLDSEGALLRLNHEFTDEKVIESGFANTESVEKALLGVTVEENALLVSSSEVEASEGSESQVKTKYSYYSFEGALQQQKAVESDQVLDAAFHDEQSKKDWIFDSGRGVVTEIGAGFAEGTSVQLNTELAMVLGVNNDDIYYLEIGDTGQIILQKYSVKASTTELLGTMEEVL